MKKIVSLLILTATLMSLLGCGCGGKALYNCGLDIVEEMHKTAQNDEYLDNFGYMSMNAYSEPINRIAASDYDEIEAVYSVSVNIEDILTKFMGYEDMDDLDEYSKHLKYKAKKLSLSSLLAEFLDPTEMAISSMLSCSVKIPFANIKKDTCLIYIYVYEDAYPVAVLFTEDLYNKVYGSGYYITNEEFVCGSKDEIKTFFENIIDCKVEKIK